MSAILHHLGASGYSWHTRLWRRKVSARHRTGRKVSVIPRALPIAAGGRREPGEIDDVRWRGARTIDVTPDPLIAADHRHGRLLPGPIEGHAALLDRGTSRSIGPRASGTLEGVADRRNRRLTRERTLFPSPV